MANHMKHKIASITGLETQDMRLASIEWSNRLVEHEKIFGDGFHVICVSFGNNIGVDRASFV